MAKVWLAAHFQRRLTRTHVTDTNINISAQSISNPDVALALRLSGQLLLGLVRIYSRKVNDAMNLKYRYLITIYLDHSESFL